MRRTTKDKALQRVQATRNSKRRASGNQKLALLGSGDGTAVHDKFQLRPFRSHDSGGNQSTPFEKVILGAPQSWGEFSDASFSVKECLTLMPKGEVSTSKDSIPLAISTDTTVTNTSGEDPNNGVVLPERQEKTVSKKSRRRVSQLWKKVTTSLNPSGGRQSKTEKQGRTTAKKEVIVDTSVRCNAGEAPKNVSSSDRYETKPVTEPDSATAAKQKALLKAKKHLRKARGRLGIDDRIDVFEPVLKINFPDAETLERRRMIRSSGTAAVPPERVQPEPRPLASRKNKQNVVRSASNTERVAASTQRVRAEVRPLAPRNKKGSVRSNNNPENATASSQRVGAERRPLTSRNKEDSVRTSTPENVPASAPQHLRAKRKPPSNLEPDKWKHGQREVTSLGISTRVLGDKHRGGLGIEPRIDVFEPAVETSFSDEKDHRRPVKGDQKLCSKNGRDGKISKLVSAPSTTHIYQRGLELAAAGHPRENSTSHAAVSDLDADYFPAGHARSSDTDVLNEFLESDSDLVAPADDLLEHTAADIDRTKNKTAKHDITAKHTTLQRKISRVQSHTKHPGVNAEHVANELRCTKTAKQSALQSNCKQASQLTNDNEEIDRLLSMLDPFSDGPDGSKTESPQMPHRRTTTTAMSRQHDSLSHQAFTTELISRARVTETSGSRVVKPLSQRKQAEHRKVVNRDSLTRREYASGPIRKYWRAYSTIRSRGSFDSASISDEDRGVQRGSHQLSPSISRSTSGESNERRMEADSLQSSSLGSEKSSLAKPEMSPITENNGGSIPSPIVDSDDGSRRKGPIDFVTESSVETGSMLSGRFSQKQNLEWSTSQSRCSSAEEEVDPIFESANDSVWSLEDYRREIQWRLASKSSRRCDPPNTKAFSRDHQCGKDPPEMKSSNSPRKKLNFQRRTQGTSIEQPFPRLDENEHAVGSDEDSEYVSPISNETTAAVKGDDNTVYSNDVESISIEGHFPPLPETRLDDDARSFATDRTTEQLPVPMTGLDATIYTISERDSNSTVSESEGVKQSRVVHGGKPKYDYEENTPSAPASKSQGISVSPHSGIRAGRGSFSDPIDVASHSHHAAWRYRRGSDDVSPPPARVDRERSRFDYNDYSPPSILGATTVEDCRSPKTDSSDTNIAVKGPDMPILPPRSFDEYSEEYPGATMKRASFDSISFVTDPDSTDGTTALYSEYIESTVFSFDRTQKDPNPPVYRRNLPSPLRDSLIHSMSSLVSEEILDEASSRSEVSSYDDTTVSGAKTGCSSFFAPVLEYFDGLQERFGNCHL